MCTGMGHSRAAISCFALCDVCFACPACGLVVWLLYGFVCTNSAAVLSTSSKLHRRISCSQRQAWFNAHNDMRGSMNAHNDKRDSMLTTMSVVQCSHGSSNSLRPPPVGLFGFHRDSRLPLHLRQANLHLSALCTPVLQPYVPLSPPLGSLQVVLDVGCGPGHLAMMCAQVRMQGTYL